MNKQINQQTKQTGRQFLTLFDNPTIEFLIFVNHSNFSQAVGSSEVHFPPWRILRS